MNYTGQIGLVMISILFTGYQKVFGQDPFFTLDFLIFTVIAWLVGWQYDTARYYGKKARANEISYKQMIDSLPESIFIHRDNKIVYLNKAAVKLLGATSKDEIIGRDLLDFIVLEYKNVLLDRINQVKKEKQPIHNIEHKISRFDGTTFFFEISLLNIIFGEKEALLSIGKDITERKEKTELMLQKSEKLALLGQMAAGIAHEIRNPLTAIKGFIQLKKADHPEDEYYTIMLNELDRINAIVSEFLVLAKPNAVVFREQNVKGLLKDVVTLINAQSILNNVQIFLEFERELPKVLCAEGQLKQVFLNVFKNAIEAMPMGGNIDVKVQLKGDDEISIQIIDQGIGISKDRISTLGEPFYTTKEKGTGLGLMTCFRIIESHNGILSFHSKENEGTTVEIILPAVMNKKLIKIH
ncbi:PAS domain S-box protein [Bacillus idriensis]|uniref:histidine kinase n=1 Tax=Metabacillus idriensis TaxID=324768 RepID=A0A6I2MI80_9BACI|nr:ATP-binding protein [Metabacillus idriensis]MRX57074.1 PAS domain S-box protein [Metabacillus idriensis]